MRVHLKKFIYTVIIISGAGITNVSAQVGNADTTKLAAVSKATIEIKSEIKEANVIFPQSLEDHKEESLDYIEKFSNKKRDYLLRTYETGKKYFPKIITVFKQYELPEELKVLIALESGFRGNAVSRAGAVGYWQIMARVAKKYGLKIASANNTVAITSGKNDERKNFNKSTLVAAKYLRDQNLTVNSDLLLLVASYNGGPGTLRRAIKKCLKPNPDFWDLKDFLPKETRNYVMNFIALSVIFNNYDNFEKNQLLFTPKMINIPFQSPEYNNSIPVEPLNVD